MILFGVATFDPEITQIPLEQVCYLIDKVIPIETCRRNQIVPLLSHETYLANQSVQIGKISLEKSLKALRQNNDSGGSLVEELEKLAGDSLPSNLVKDYKNKEPFVIMAMVNPDNLQALDELGNILRYRG